MRTKPIRPKERKHVRPKAIPILTKEQFNIVVREMKRTPSNTDLQRVERVKQILKNIQL